MTMACDTIGVDTGSVLPVTSALKLPLATGAALHGTAMLACAVAVSALHDSRLSQRVVTSKRVSRSLRKVGAVPSKIRTVGTKPMSRSRWARALAIMPVQAPPTARHVQAPVPARQAA